MIALGDARRGLLADAADQRPLIALRVSLIVTIVNRHFDIALIRQAGRMAGCNLGADGFAILRPMLPEDARNAGRGEEKCVGLRHISREAVVIAIRIMIIYERNRVSAGRIVMNQAGGAPGLAILLPSHLAKIGFCESVVKGLILHREIKGRRVVTRSFDPGFTFIVRAIPILAYGEVGLRSRIIVADKAACKALDEIVAPRIVAKVGLEPSEVGLYVLPNIGVRVVEIARAAPVFARISCTRSLAAPIARIGVGVHLVRIADMLSRELEAAESAKVILGKIAPARETGSMIDDDVCDNVDAGLAESSRQAFQVGRTSPAGLLIAPLLRMVADIEAAGLVVAFAGSRGRQPNHCETFANIAHLGQQLRPTREVLRIPIKALQHNVLRMAGHLGIQGACAQEKG